MNADLPNAPSPRTRVELQEANNQVIRMACPEFGETAWPAGLLQAALTRDGDHQVIGYLAKITVKTTLAVSEHSGQSPAAVIGTCRAAMGSGDLPFSADSWTRAQDLTLHGLGEPLQIYEEPVEAIDLAGALVLLHVLGTMLFHKAQTDARRAGTHPARPRAPHRTTKRGKKPRRR